MSDEHPGRIATFSKHISVSVVVLILGQTFGGGWWAASISERLTSVELWRAESKDTTARIAVLESQMSDIKDILHRIEAQLTDQHR